jgi:hypothetical protein
MITSRTLSDTRPSKVSPRKGIKRFGWFETSSADRSKSVLQVIASARPVLRLPGILLIPACLGALLVAGAGRAADGKRGFFDIRVRGEITKRWTYVENKPDTECEVRRTFRGRETFSFRSRRPTRVLIRSRADASLVLGAMLWNISGMYVQSGSRSTAR